MALALLLSQSINVHIIESSHDQSETDTAGTFLSVFRTNPEVSQPVRTLAKLTRLMIHILKSSIKRMSTHSELTTTAEGLEQEKAIQTQIDNNVEEGEQVHAWLSSLSDLSPELLSIFTSICHG